MRATVTRVWDTLRAGRPMHEVAAQLAAAFGMAAVLWACACAFMLMEPLP